MNHKQETQEVEHSGSSPRDDFNFEGLELLDVVPKRDKYWWHYPYLLKLNLLLISGIMWSTASGFDGSLFNGMQALPQWKHYFGNPTGNDLSLSNVPNIVANIIGNAIGFWFTDRWGRRWIIIAGSLLIIISAVLRGFAQNYAWWCWVQVIQGFGTAFVSVAAPPYITEAAYPTHRAKAVSLYAGTYAVGGLVAAGLNYGLLKIPSTWGWRTAVLCQCVPSAVQAVLAYFAPESPRWLVFKERKQEAFDMLCKYHAGGDVNSRLVHFELSEIVASIEQEKLTGAGKWLDYFKTKGNMHRLVISIVIPMSLQWAGNGLISYYLPVVLQTIGITDPNKVLGINIGNSAWSLTGSFTALFVIDRFGRRKLFLYGYSLMLCSLIIWTACSAIDAQRGFKDTGLAAAVILMIYLFGSFYHLCSASGSPYIMEITPYTLRSKAAGLYQISGALPNLFNTWVNPIAMEAIGWKYYIVWTCLVAVWLAFIYFAVPETKNKGLEEIAVVFDGEDAIVGTNAMKKFGLEGKFQTGTS